MGGSGVDGALGGELPFFFAGDLRAADCFTGTGAALSLAPAAAEELDEAAFAVAADFRALTSVLSSGTAALEMGDGGGGEPTLLGSGAPALRSSSAPDFRLSCLGAGSEVRTDPTSATLGVGGFDVVGEDFEDEDEAAAARAPWRACMSEVTSGPEY